MSAVTLGGGSHAQERSLGLVTTLLDRSRRLVPELPRPVWALQAGGLANAVGSGLVLPFLLIYLHDTRGIPLASAGLVVGAFGLLSMAATPFAGSLVDRFGARLLLAASLVVLAAGFALLPFAHSARAAVLAVGLAGLGNGGFWPSQSTLAMTLTPRERRHEASALTRASYNLGLGIGSALGGLLLASGGGARFTLLFLADAATFVVFAAVVLSLRVPRSDAAARGAGGGYRRVLADRPFVGLLLVNLLAVVAGYAVFESVLPVFARDQAGLSPRTIGLVFLANMLAVAVLQLPLAKALAGRRRLGAVALTGGLWLAAFALVPLATPAAFVAAAILFAAGECLLGPAVGPLVVDLAPEELRGRYLALFTNSYALGFAAGPAAGAFALGISPRGVWVAAAAAAGLVAVAALGLERRVPAAARRTPA
ncbi:MAG TPA: MFS transporter [Gaiellaceae bacterium]|nr:MFS transporter [Gaiellaceae bacterium]